jgi:hypothetical protein
MALHIKNISSKDLLETDTILLDNIEKAAGLCFFRKQRFIDYDVEKELTKLYNDFFGNTNINQKNGLIHQYKLLREKVIQEKLVGLVLTGINLKEDILIDYYPTQNGNLINLTVQGISRFLLKEFFSQDEIHSYAQASPNFDKYYDHILENEQTEVN